MKRIILAACLASVVTAPLRADLKYTTHMEIKKRLTYLIVSVNFKLP